MLYIVLVFSIVFFYEMNCLLLCYSLIDLVWSGFVLVLKKIERILHRVRNVWIQSRFLYVVFVCLCMDIICPNTVKYGIVLGCFFAQCHLTFYTKQCFVISIPNPDFNNNFAAFFTWKQRYVNVERMSTHRNDVVTTSFWHRIPG